MVEEYVIPEVVSKPVISAKNLDLPVSSREAFTISHKFLNGMSAVVCSVFLRNTEALRLFFFLIIPESSE